MIAALLTIIFILALCLYWAIRYARNLDRDTTHALKIAGMIIAALAGRMERMERERKES